jgi:hypothetical protein
VEAALRAAGFEFQHNQRAPTSAGTLIQPTKTENRARHQREPVGV